MPYSGARGRGGAPCSLILATQPAGADVLTCLADACRSSSCLARHAAEAGDTCEDIASRFKVLQADLELWNPGGCGCPEGVLRSPSSDVLETRP